METNKLYHYCKLSTAIEFILPAKQLLLNKLGKTNDPRENKSFVFAGLNMDYSDPTRLIEPNHIISQEIRNGCKILCLCGDRSPYFGYELSRMWALYGENHQGVCIELNKDVFLKENSDKIANGMFQPIKYYKLDVTQPISHRSVDYGRISDIGLQRYIKEEFRPENMEYLFFTKNHEWESEQEYRVLYFSENNGKEFCSISNSIECIHVGVDFNEHYLPALRNHCTNVDIYKLEYRDVRLITFKKLA
jgi:hypothetical protein